MKQQTPFVLEDAPWPAWLLDDRGRAVRANAAASALTSLGGGIPRDWSDLWTKGLNPPAFSRLLGGGTSVTPFSPDPGNPKSAVPLAGTDPDSGREVLWCLSAVHRERQSYWMVQMVPVPAGVELPRVAPQPPTPAPAPAPVPVPIPIPPPVSAPVPVAPVPPVVAAVLKPSPPVAERAEEPTVDAVVAHRQKLECALQLARSVASDFNNALSGILGHSSLLLSQAGADHPWRASLLEIEKSAQRAAEVAHDLGTFSRQEKERDVAPPGTPGTLNELIRRAVGLFSTQEDCVVTWKLELEKRLFAVACDEARVHQALVRVLENAVQSIEDEGTVVVTSRNVELDGPLRDEGALLAPGVYVCIETRDTGCGIAAELMPRIFEPFFTTKQTGKHRGLGLAWVYGIATNHGGNVAVSSRKGEGTSVRVYLPAQRRWAQETDVEPTELRGSHTVLVVDDEELVLTMVQTILAAYGYTVLTADNGNRALEVIQENPGVVDLVLTDLVMPMMSGRELIERLRQTAPEVRILCSSGYLRSHEAGDGTPYLKKPFTSGELLTKVKQALE